MKRLTIILIISVLVSLNGFSQKCNIETIKNLRLNKDNLTDSLMLSFLTSIDETCKNNVEWTEASNWTLYWLADVETKSFIDLLKSNKSTIDIPLIIDEFKQPVNDAIDLIGIYKKLTDLNDKDEIVINILNSIKSAANGLDIEIK